MTGCTWVLNSAGQVVCTPSWLTASNVVAVVLLLVALVVVGLIASRKQQDDEVAAAIHETRYDRFLELLEAVKGRLRS